MSKQDEEVFLNNVLLGTDYLTSLAATGRSRRPSGCLLLVVAGLILLVTLWLVW